MKHLNWGLLICGLVGAIVAVALPIAKLGPVEVKLLDVGGHGYLTLGVLLAGAAMGAVNLFKAPARWTSGVALVAFLIAGMKLSGEDGIEMGAGAEGAMVLAFVGVLLAIALTIKPGKK